MDSADVLKILDAVLDSPTAERTAQLEALCGGDTALRREVERLLALEAEATDFLDGPAVKFQESVELPFHGSMERQLQKLPERQLQKTAERLGPYRLLDVLGQGGMGTVYRAVREDDFEKQVALKVLRRELASSAMVERFHAERQILAHLEHSGIARLLDGGTLPDGRPYLVMEYVEGEPVDRFCTHREFSLRERLEVFRNIALAVAFAHRHLIVHRDIKPSNVLVTADGVPKLLDFGIAKLLDREPRLSQATDAAEGPKSGAMTPRYASPEQLAGDAVTTASDVYALGLLLYKMLVGTLPYRLQDCPVNELERLRGVEPEQTGQGADVDAIVAKALRKDPTERYASAEQLADEINRYLRHRPVQARQGGWFYVSGKLARRHPGATLAMILFVFFSLGSSVLWRQAVAERQRADGERILALREQERAERVSAFLKELFRSADPNADRGGRQTVREVLAEGRLRLAEGLEDEPELKAALAGTLGDVYRNLGLYEEAVELMRQSVELRRPLYPAGDMRLAVALNDLGSVLYYMEHYSEAEDSLHESLELRRRLEAEPSGLAQTINNLASVLKHQGDYAAAGKLYEEALALRRATHSSGSTAVASSLYSLGSLRFREGNHEEAEPLLRQALQIYQGTYGEQHTRVASVLHTLGRLLHARGELAEAEDLLRRALDVRRELLGDEDARVVATRADLEAVLAPSE